MARHPITGIEIEDGHGALPVEDQVQNHLRQIERVQGLEQADAMRRQLDLPTSQDLADKAAADADVNKDLVDRVTEMGVSHMAVLRQLNDHHARIAALEEMRADIEARMDRLTKAAPAPEPETEPYADPKPWPETIPDAE